MTLSSTDIPIQASADDERLIAQYVRTFTDSWDAFTATLTPPSECRPACTPSVVINTWLKSGTTLTQHLLYQLLVLTGRVPTDPTGTDFFDMSEAVPFIGFCKNGVVTPTHPHSPATHISHDSVTDFHSPQWDDSFFIFIVRDGRTAMRSFVDYTAEWLAKLSVPDHLREVFYERIFRSHFLGYGDTGLGAAPAAPVRWFHHNASWLSDKRTHGRVLFLIYEDIVRDMSTAVKTIAKFVGIPVDDKIVAEVVRRADRETMAKEPRFRSRLMSIMYGLDINSGNRVRTIHAKGYKDILSKKTENDYKMMFKSTFGVETYAELCEIFRRRNDDLDESLY